jgi:hypothetical protein
MCFDIPSLISQPLSETSSRIPALHLDVLNSAGPCLTHVFHLLPLPSRKKDTTNAFRLCSVFIMLRHYLFAPVNKCSEELQPTWFSEK